ncbi:MAG: response regulator transcription factor [Bacteroidetes bacterium]|nr:response regulator transcription factor [Bacteroidota bacterium]
MNLQEPIKRVAIAEGDELIRAGIIKIIKDLGAYSIDIEAGSGPELIQKLQDASELPDICVIPVELPGMNGYDTMLRITQRWPQIKGMALSRCDKEFSIFKMFECGASAYVLKKQPVAILQKALTEICEKGCFYSEEILAKLSKNLRGQLNSAKEQLLNAKEILFLSLCYKDLSYEEIAWSMCLSLNTVHEYRKSLFRKLNVHSKTGLALYAKDVGLTCS